MHRDAIAFAAEQNLIQRFAEDFMVLRPLRNLGGS